MTDDKLNTSLSANTIMAKLTNHVQRTNFITSPTDKYYSLDSEMTSAQVVETSVTNGNNSSSQKCPHPDNHTTRKTLLARKSIVSSKGTLVNREDTSCETKMSLFGISKL